ncbi:MAG: oligosaccharide flippase family protein [Chloroflexota bacterium]|nr:oligosaccharide flippase family protein [Chloroflexota bacterium]
MTQWGRAGQEGPVAEPVAEPLPAANVADALSRRISLRGSLRETAARGALINSAFLVTLSGLGLVKGFLLAGFLSRSDYGLWGLLAVSLGSLLSLKHIGIGDKYIQQDGEDQELAFQKAFTLELLITGSFIVLAAASLPLFAVLYGTDEVLAPGLVILVAFVATIFQTPLWILYRRMEFARQRTLQAIDPIVAFVVSVALAAAGAGYWALVIGFVAGPVASAAVTMRYSPFKLRLRYDRGTARDYVSFSWPLFVSGVAGLVIAQAAVIAAEAQLGLAAVGVIALAATITAFTDRVDELVTGTLYPAICAVRERSALLYESFVKSNRLALMWAVPFGTAITLFCSDLVSFGIGERWRPAVDVLQVYGIVAAVGHVGFNWTAYFRARGDTKPIAVASASAMAAFLAVGIPLLLSYGLRGFALGVAFQGLVHLSVRGFYLQRLFEGFGFLRHAARSFLPTLPAAAVVLLLRAVESGERTLGLAVGELSLYLAAVLAATWYFESNLLREAFGYLVRGARATPRTT